MCKSLQIVSVLFDGNFGELSGWHTMIQHLPANARIYFWNICRVVYLFLHMNIKGCISRTHKKSTQINSCRRVSSLGERRMSQMQRFMRCGVALLLRAVASHWSALDSDHARSLQTRLPAQVPVLHAVLLVRCCHCSTSPRPWSLLRAAMEMDSDDYQSPLTGLRSLRSLTP